jgi:dihydroneopterin aldolase
MSDTIRLINMTIYGYHGVSPAEKETGRRFEVDVELSVDVREATKTDRLTDTVNYTEVYQVVEEILSREHYALLETIAERLADAILGRFHVESVLIRVRKKIPPIPGNLDHIEVEIERP